jgi:hypothetical protein
MRYAAAQYSSTKSALITAPLSDAEKKAKKKAKKAAHKVQEDSKKGYCFLK